MVLKEGFNDICCLPFLFSFYQNFQSSLRNWHLTLCSPYCLHLERSTISLSQPMKSMICCWKLLHDGRKWTMSYVFKILKRYFLVMNKLDFPSCTVAIIQEREVTCWISSVCVWDISITLTSVLITTKSSPTQTQAKPKESHYKPAAKREQRLEEQRETICQREPAPKPSPVLTYPG